MILGYIVVAPIAYYWPSWRMILLISSLPSLISAIIYALIVPESYRFLVLMGKEAALQRWLDKAAKHGNRAHFSAAEIVATNPPAPTTARTGDSAAASFINDNIVFRLLQQKKILLYVLIFSYIWSVDAFLYYGQVLYSTTMAGNKYINYTLAGMQILTKNMFQSLRLPSFLTS